MDGRKKHLGYLFLDWGKTDLLKYILENVSTVLCYYVSQSVQTMYKHTSPTGIIYRRITLKNEIIHHELKKMAEKAIVANFKIIS
jgi:hypothetical protein